MYKAGCSVASQLSHLPHVFVFSPCFTRLYTSRTHPNTRNDSL